MALYTVHGQLHGQNRPRGVFAFSSKSSRSPREATLHRNAALHNFGAAFSRFLLTAYPKCRCNRLCLLDLLASVREASESPMRPEQRPKQAATVLEIPPQAQSGESKPTKRGGRRPGAGRKPNLAKRLLKGFSREALAAAVAEVDCGAVLVSLLKSKRERTRLEALVFYRDTFWGRPAQNVALSGGIIHAHAGWGSLSHLSDEEMDLLDKLTKKLAAPVSNASPDGPQNQIESKPAIEAEIVESNAQESPEAPPGEES